MFDKIAVIGAGTMGTGVSSDLLLKGYEVTLVDINQEQLNEARKEIKNVIRMAPLLIKDMKTLDVKAILNKLTLTTRLSDIKECDFVIENISEKKEAKFKLYEELDQLMNQEVCFGVNTSCISITEVAAHTNRADKIIGIHFMNPVYLKNAVEVIRGFYTSDVCIEIVREFLTSIQKKVILVNDYPGFVANRISHLFMNEAAYVVQDQVADAKQVDDIFKECYGHNMGPLETADLIGLDVVVDSLNVLYESYQDQKFRCCPLLKKLVSAGCLGKKTGKGFYTYHDFI